MKVLLILCLLSINLFAQTINPSILRDLNLLKNSRSIGGAGNCGGDLALKISRQLNRRAFELGVKDMCNFSNYTVLVESYNFCGLETSVCNLAAKFYSSHSALLINGTNWKSLLESEKNATLDELVIEIAND